MTDGPWSSVVGSRVRRGERRAAAMLRQGDTDVPPSMLRLAGLS